MPAVIYESDAQFIDRANIFFFDLCNEDPGTMVELGMAFEKLRSGIKVKIYAVNSDFRAPANTRSGFNSTIGFNSFMTGGIYKLGFSIYTSFDDALIQYIFECFSRVFICGYVY